MRHYKLSPGFKNIKVKNMTIMTIVAGQQAAPLEEQVRRTCHEHALYTVMQSFPGNPARRLAGADSTSHHANFLRLLRPGTRWTLWISTFLPAGLIGGAGTARQRAALEAAALPARPHRVQQN